MMHFVPEHPGIESGQIDRGRQRTQVVVPTRDVHAPGRQHRNGVRVFNENCGHSKPATYSLLN